MKQPTKEWLKGRIQALEYHIRLMELTHPELKGKEHKLINGVWTEIKKTNLSINGVRCLDRQ